MDVAISRRELDPATPYRFVGGDRSIDFVNTATWVGYGPDRFANYGRIVEWAEGSGAVSPQIASSLRALGEEYPAGAVRALGDAVRLRRLLERLFFHIAEHQSTREEITELNEKWLSASIVELALAATGNGRFELGWPRASRVLESPLWVVARSAATLLASSDVTRIRRCSGDDCGWYYVDRSRNGLRRWCEMETCGTHMKSRRRAERIAASKFNLHSSGDRS